MGSIRIIGGDGQSIDLPLSLREEGRRLRVDRPGVEVPGQTGFARSGIDRVQERTLRIVGTWWEPDPDYLKGRLDDLRAVLMSGVLQIYPDVSRSRYFVGEVTEISTPWQEHAIESHVDISILLSDPFEYGSLGSASRQGISGQTDFDASVGGNVQVYPLVTFTPGAAGVSGLRIDNLRTGQALILNGQFGVGDDVLVDVAKFIAMRNGTLINTQLDDQFLFQGFHLLSGTNTLRANSATGSFDVMIEWQERWF